MKSALKPASQVPRNDLNVPRVILQSSNQAARAQAQQTYAPNQAMKFPCLYTKQVQKKRKAWSDGFARISYSKGVYFCSLMDAEDLRGKCLESRQLEQAEVAKLKKQENFVVNMETHLVELDFSLMTENTGSTNVQSKSEVNRLKLPKFVPPSTVAPARPAPRSLHDSLNTQNVEKYGDQSHSPGARISGGDQKQAKRSLDDELDDIWGPPFAPSTIPHQSSTFNDNYSLSDYANEKNNYQSSSYASSSHNEENFRQGGASRPNNNKSSSSKSSSPTSKSSRVTFAHEDMLKSVYQYDLPDKPSQEKGFDENESSVPRPSSGGLLPSNSKIARIVNTSFSSAPNSKNVASLSTQLYSQVKKSIGGWEDDWIDYNYNNISSSSKPSLASDFDIHGFEWK